MNKRYALRALLNFGVLLVMPSRVPLYYSRIAPLKKCHRSRMIPSSFGSFQKGRF